MRKLIAPGGTLDVGETGTDEDAQTGWLSAVVPPISNSISKSMCVAASVHTTLLEALSASRATAPIGCARTGCSRDDAKALSVTHGPSGPLAQLPSIRGPRTYYSRPSLS